MDQLSLLETSKRPKQPLKPGIGGVVYGIYDGDSLMYVGSTNNLERRRQAHLHAGNIHKLAKWLRRRRKPVEFRVIEECATIEDARECERQWIWKLDPPLNSALTKPKPKLRMWERMLIEQQEQKIGTLALFE